MKCVGCGDINIVINSCAPLCQHCADNTYTGGEYGDLEQEREILPRVDFEMEVTQGIGVSPCIFSAIVDEAEWLAEGVSMEIDLEKNLFLNTKPLVFVN
jgi:hypothetical protein